MTIEKRGGMSRGQLRASLLRRLISGEIVGKVTDGKIARAPGQTIDDRLGQCGIGSVGGLAEVLLDHQEEMGKLLEGVNEALTVKMAVSQRVDANNSAIGILGERLDTQSQTIGGLREASTSSIRQLTERAQGADEAIRFLREHVEGVVGRIGEQLNGMASDIQTGDERVLEVQAALGTWSDRFSEQIVEIAADAAQALEKVGVVEVMSDFVRGTDARVLELERKALHAIERVDELERKAKSAKGQIATLVEQTQIEASTAHTGHLAETAQRLDERINGLSTILSRHGGLINQHDDRLNDSDLIVSVTKIKKRVEKLEEDEIPNVISGISQAMDAISNITIMMDGLAIRISNNLRQIEIHEDRFSNHSEMLNPHEEAIVNLINDTKANRQQIENQGCQLASHAGSIDDVNHDIRGLDSSLKALSQTVGAVATTLASDSTERIERLRAAVEKQVTQMALKLPTDTDVINLNARMDSLYDGSKVLRDELTQRADVNEVGLASHDLRIIGLAGQLQRVILDLNAQLGNHNWGSPINTKLTPREKLIQSMDERPRPISHIPSPTGGLSEAEAMEAGCDEIAYPDDVKAPGERVNVIHATGSPAPLGDIPRRFHIPEPSVKEAQLRARLDERLINFRGALIIICEISSRHGRQPYGVEILGTKINEVARRAVQADDRQAEFTGAVKGHDLETTQLALEDNEKLRRQAQETKGLLDNQEQTIENLQDSITQRNTALARVRPILGELQDLRDAMKVALAVARDSISFEMEVRSFTSGHALLGTIDDALTVEKLARVPDPWPLDAVMPQPPEGGLERGKVIIHEGNSSSEDAQVAWPDVQNAPITSFETDSDGTVHGVNQWKDIQTTANARRDEDREDHEG